jgi:hypothetical protein
VNARSVPDGSGRDGAARRGDSPERLLAEKLGAKVVVEAPTPSTDLDVPDPRLKPAPPGWWEGVAAP